MKNRPLGSHLIAGAILAGTGGITTGLAAIAHGNLFATAIGIILIATGLVVMCGVWIAATWDFLFQMYVRLYRAQWNDADDARSESSV